MSTKVEPAIAAAIKRLEDAVAAAAITRFEHRRSLAEQLKAEQKEVEDAREALAAAIMGFADRELIEPLKQVLVEETAKAMAPLIVQEVIIDRIRAAVQSWLNKQGHDRCWYYPEIFNEIARILCITAEVPANLPPLAEFEKGCKRYQLEQYPVEESK